MSAVHFSDILPKLLLFWFAQYYLHYSTYIKDDVIYFQFSLFLLFSQYKCNILHHTVINKGYAL